MKKITEHLEYSWWKYLLVLVLPIVLWCSIFDVMARPKDDERLNILYLGTDLDTYALQQTLQEYLPQHTQQELKQIRVVEDLLSDEYYGQKMVTYSFEFDLIIVSEDFMRPTTGQFFRSFAADTFSDYDDVELYTEELEDETGKFTLPFGILLWEPGDDTNFGNYYSGNQKCYLFFSTESVNLYPLFSGSSEGNNAAVVAMEFLMGK